MVGICIFSEMCITLFVARSAAVQLLKASVLEKPDHRKSENDATIVNAYSFKMGACLYDWAALQLIIPMRL